MDSNTLPERVSALHAAVNFDMVKVQWLSRGMMQNSCFENKNWMYFSPSESQYTNVFGKITQQPALRSAC